MSTSKTIFHSKTTYKNETAVLVNGTTSGPVTLKYATTWNNQVTYGDNIPNWRSVIANGGNATTSLVGSDVKIRVVPGSYRSERPKTGLPGTAAYIVRHEGNLCKTVAIPSSDPVLIVDTQANNDALIKFNKQVKRINTAFEGGVFVGELAQTLYGIRNPARALRNLASRWWHNANNIRGRFLRLPGLGLRALREALAESWLEQAFHWKPLLNDIDDGCRALAEFNTEQALYSGRCKGVGESQASSSELVTGHNSGFARWVIREITYANCIVVYRGAMAVRPRNSVLMTGRLLGFQADNWIPTLWELLPYSFLIDYFTNIGDILAGWGHTTLNLSWCNRTVKKEWVVIRNATSDLKETQLSWPTVTSVSCKPSTVEVRKSNVSRQVYVGFLTPTLEYDIPGLGSRKWLNIAALIVNRNNDRSFQYGD